MTDDRLRALIAEALTKWAGRETDYRAEQAQMVWDALAPHVVLRDSMVELQLDQFMVENDFVIRSKAAAARVAELEAAFLRLCDEIQNRPEANAIVGGLAEVARRHLNLGSTDD